MLPADGLQELGQQVEARRLAGPVRTDQRVNAAAADLQRDIANGEKPREFLGQSVGFENELIGQTNSPISPAAKPSRMADFYFGGLSRTPWNVPDLPPPGRNMPSSRRIRQGGKHGRCDAGAALPSPLVEYRPARRARPAAGPAVRARRKAFVNAVLLPPRTFIENFRLRRMLCRFAFHGDRRAWNSKAPIQRSSSRSSSVIS